jgi:hypothetical protein
MGSICPFSPVDYGGIHNHIGFIDPDQARLLHGSFKETDLLRTPWSDDLW